LRLFLEESERRPRALWRLLAQYVFFAVAATLFLYLLKFAWALVRPSGTGLGGTAQTAVGSSDLLLTGSLASLAAIFLSLWLAGRFLDRRPFADFGFHLSKGWLLDLFFGMLLGALLMTFIFLTQLAFGWVSVTGSFEAVTPGASFVPEILLPIGIFVCVGFYEEMLYRGYLLRNLAEGLNFPGLGPRGAILAAWLLSSSAFGILHAFNPNATLASTINIALAGLLLGLGYVLTGELAIPIGLHIAWNFFQGNVYGFPVSGLNPIGATFLTIKQGGPDLFTGGVFGPEGGLLEPAAVLLGCLLITLWVRLRHRRAAIQTHLAERPKQVLLKGERSHQMRL